MGENDWLENAEEYLARLEKVRDDMNGIAQFVTKAFGPRSLLYNPQHNPLSKTSSAFTASRQQVLAAHKELYELVKGIKDAIAVLKRQGVEDMLARNLILSGTVRIDWEIAKPILDALRGG